MADVCRGAAYVVESDAVVAMAMKSVAANASDESETSLE